MADSVGVRIDGEIVSGPARPAAPDRPRDGARAGAPAMLRRRLLLSLAGLLVALLALSAAVDLLRDDAVSGQGTAGLIKGIDPCPPARSCGMSDQPSLQMYDATYQAFPDYNQVSSSVVFDARTGVTYSQTTTLSKDGIVIRLTSTRAPGSAPRAMRVDVTAASSDGIVVTAIPADGSPDRESIAALSGPEDALLPVDAAIAWASTVDLFGDG